MKRRLWVAALVCLVASNAPAQNTTIVRGNVIDQEGQPLEGTEVLLEYLGSARRTLTTASDEKGEYMQTGLSSGLYRITYQKDGYVGGTIEERLTGLTRLPEFRMVALELGAPPDETRSKAKETFDRGIELTRAGSYDEALAAFDEVIDVAPGLAEGHYKKGFVLIQMQNWDAAEASLKEAIELDAEHANAKLALSELYQETGRAAEALALMNAAAGDESEDARVHFNRGIFNLNAGNTAEALAAFQKSEQLDPDNPEVHFHLGTLAVGQTNIDEAIERLERYLSMSPEHEQNKATAEGLLQALKK